MAEKTFYTVRSRTKERGIIWFGLVFFILLAGMIVLLAVTDDAAGNYLLLLAAAVLFIALCAFRLYLERRPRIVVAGETLVCYPRWHKKIRVQLGEITARRAEPIPNGALAYGTAGYSASGNAFCKKITYFRGDLPVITFNSGMENAARLDHTVRERLEA